MAFERRPSLADLVTNRLRQEIVNGTFDFGCALSESKISKRYDVSRTPVREAFARLELEELVRTEPQSGTYVFMMDRVEFEQISETRSVLECAALRFACERNLKILKVQWRQVLDDMKSTLDAKNTSQYSELDGTFHDTLFDLASNPYLTRARGVFAARMEAIRNRLGLTKEHTAKSFAEHKNLVELIEGCKTDEAVAVLHLHITKKGAGFWSVPEQKQKVPDKYEKLM